ncbi:MAG: dienelactone hydrolase family protein [Lewinellaceae bacterium]|jgi:carboxymethylenebutenolidase|nr:dienelactone hydrolase family protein [Lewinellaceae bacterium]
MKNLLLLAVLLGFFACRNQEPSIPMCHDPNAAFAAFASDKDFQNAHPTPQPAVLTHGGKNIEFPVEGGENGRGFLITAHGQTNKYLLLFHEWWGLNDNIRNEASYWVHSLGINVLAVDLYDGKLATEAADAGKLMQACDAARAKAIIQGAAKFVGEKADFRTMGWCFGGGWSLQAALLLGDRAKACVMYYGMPEKDVETLKTLQTDVLMIHAKQDKWINDTVVGEFEEHMKQAEKSLTVKEYDANHAFANPSNPSYNEQAAKDARAAVMAYLKGK